MSPVILFVISIGCAISSLVTGDIGVLFAGTVSAVIGTILE